MKRYNPRVEQTRKKHVLPAWAVTPTFILGVIIVVAALVMAIFPEQIAPYDPTAVNITARTKAPSAEHIFGTDNYRQHYRPVGGLVRRLAGQPPDAH